MSGDGRASEARDQARLDGRIVRVVWKDEGDFGFISSYTQADLDFAKQTPDSLGVPYDPDRVRAYGSVQEAEALALEHDAELVLS